MALIDIGHGAAVGDAGPPPNYTRLDLTNPANATGTIDTFEAYAYTGQTMSFTKIGTFYGSSLSWNDRDYESVGTVTSGAKRTFSGLDCDVATNDIIGAHWTDGLLYANATGGSGILYVVGNKFGGGAYTYTFQADRWLALYGTGADIVIPTVTTQAVTAIQETTATGHGTITNTGGENCTKRGVCWNTTGNPTVANSKSEETGSFGTGAFTRPMTGLSGGEHYYVRAYAYNSAGYGYGTQVVFDTITIKDSSDTGSGTDVKASYPTASYTQNETGSGDDAKKSDNPLATFPLRVESGIGIEHFIRDIPGDIVASLSVLHTRSEAGSGVEALPSKGSVFFETGSGSELSSILASLLKGETGVGAEASFIDIILSLSHETGIGVDALVTLLSGLTASETGTGLESLIARLLGVSDTGSGVETLLGNLEKFVSETGLGVETILSLLGKVAHDVGSCTYEGSYLHTIESMVAGSDTGSGVDASSLLASVLRQESGIGVETVLARAIYTRELPSGAIDLARVIAATLAGQDVGIGAESSFKAFVLKVTDTGTGSELATLQALFNLSDSGLGAEVLTLLATIIANDVGTSVDAVLNFLKTSYEAGSGEETLALVAFVVKATDVGSGVDSILEFTRRLLEDGVGTETILGFYRTALEAGVGLDTLVFFARELVDSGEGVELVNIIGALGRAMRLITYLRAYSDLITYTKPYSDLRTYTSEVKK